MKHQETLIRKLKNKDRKAFQEIYEQFADEMRFICLRYIKNHELVSDVLQEGFIKMYNKIDLYNGEGSFEGWLRRLFINTSIDYLEKIKRRKEVYYIDEINEGWPDDPQEDEMKSTNNVEPGNITFSQDELLEMINALPEHFRIVFNLYAIDEYQHKDIAEILGIKLKTSKTRLLRARQLLKKEIDKKLEKQTI